MKRTLGRIAVAIAAAGLVWVGAEGILRGAGYGSLVVYAPDRDLFWAPLPDQRAFTKIGHEPVTINAHGSRGSEFSAQKPADVVRILSLGDSRTFGWGVADGETFSARLQELLQRACAGTWH